MQTLDYLPPPAFPRPGILVAVGVMSILFGALGAMMGCWSGVGTGMLFFMPRPVPVAPAPAPAPASAPAGTVVLTTAAFTPVSDPLTIAASVIDGALRLGLALLLIVAGILVLRDHRLGRKLHLIWAWIKIPAALLGALASWNMSMNMFASMPATPGMSSQTIELGLLISTAFGVVFACAYPIAVLIVMKTRTVRDYYTTRFGAGTGETPGA